MLVVVIGNVRSEDCDSFNGYEDRDKPTGSMIEGGFCKRSYGPCKGGRDRVRGGYWKNGVWSREMKREVSSEWGVGVKGWPCTHQLKLLVSFIVQICIHAMRFFSLF